ncbi:MAG: hypothetical protein VX499_02985 [Bacteroidota bacterium]|nr:hypothetical protein [Bacteroidota bacterium]
MNKIKWAMVFQTKYPYQAEIVIQVLKKNFIDSVPHNKIDTSYNNFGYYEVLVNEKNYLESIKLIEKIKFDE